MSPDTLRKLELGTGSCIGWSLKESEAKKYESWLLCGLMHRQWKPHSQDPEDSVKQLVLPLPC